MSDIAAPRHVGIILDGNRRWAKKRGLPSIKGHNAGTENTREVLQRALDLGVQYVSLFVFSTENWKRTEEEVGHLIGLLVRVMKKEKEKLLADNLKVVFSGQRSHQKLSKSTKEAMVDLEESTKDNTAGTLVMCFNYGGQTEIIDAAKAAIESGMPAEDLDQDAFEQFLYTPDVPELDLVIRTSGEHRISGFQLWRAAYAEFLFVDKNWPDFTAEDMELAVAEYCNRDRRKGK